MLNPRGQLSVRSAEDGNVVAVYGPIVIFRLARRVNERELSCLGEVVTDGLRSKSPWGLLVVFARTDLSGGIDGKAREIFERLVRQDADVLERSAVVVSAEGFAGAVGRGIVAGLLQLAGKRKQLAVLSTVREACEVVARAHRLDPLDLERAYDEATGG